jgi:hypothetical protein
MEKEKEEKVIYNSKLSYNDGYYFMTGEKSMIVKILQQIEGYLFRVNKLDIEM